MNSKEAKKNKFVCSFFGRIYGAPIFLQFYLTFSRPQIFSPGKQSQADPRQKIFFSYKKPWNIFSKTPTVLCQHHSKRCLHHRCWSRIVSFSYKRNGSFLPKLFWPTVRKKIVLVIEKNIWNSRQKAKNLQKFWDQICSNSDRSEQFLVTEWFLNLFLEVCQIK